MQTWPQEHALVTRRIIAAHRIANPLHFLSGLVRIVDPSPVSGMTSPAHAISIRLFPCGGTWQRNKLHGFYYTKKRSERGVVFVLIWDCMANLI
jgi:hypothetical protein